MLSAQRTEEIANRVGFKIRGLRWWIVGLIFLAHEGLSLASLKTMEEQQAADETALVEQEARESERERAPV